MAVEAAAAEAVAEATPEAETVAVPLSVLAPEAPNTRLRVEVAEAAADSATAVVVLLVALG